MTRRLLIVSPHFPPVNAPDMQRVRMSLPFFIEAGWQVTVLTVADPTPLAPVDPELAATVPRECRVVRARCLSRRWTAWLGVNNVALRSLPFLFFTGCRLLRAARYDVVYFSTTMFIVLPFGRVWRRLFGVPFVVDLQDPWVTDFYERPGSPPPPGGWKYRLAKTLGCLLEGWTLRAVSRLIVVSADYGERLRHRYPDLAGLAISELPFGSPDPDLDRVRHSLGDRRPILPAHGFRLAFVGAIGPGMLPAIEVLLAALARVRPEIPGLQVYFFGTSYAVEATGTIPELARRHGVQDLVHEQPGRLRYFDALQVTFEAEVNLLFGSSDLAFTPSKILSVLATGRSALALAPQGSAMNARLAHLRQPVFAFGDDPAGEGVVSAVAGHLQQLARGAEPRGAWSHPAFSARAVAQRQMEILASAAGA